ncbi:MAG: hypothetical protein QE493_02845 [Verrucomicrobiae bacterium]|jgi:hypothetical protein|nr:hypothetical protein [Verrucomicrobiae bacterium]
MKSTISLLTVTAVLMLTGLILTLMPGCANGPTVDPQVTSIVSAHDVYPVTRNKINHGQHLDYDDIMNLVKSKVPTYVIVGYLRSTEAVYHFTYAQLHHLRAMGASRELVNYLTETQGFYGNNKTASSGFKVPKYIRANSMLNQDKQPFFYNEPIVDDWYDSVYEESCYSPFSFN